MNSGLVHLGDWRGGRWFGFLPRYSVWMRHESELVTRLSSDFWITTGLATQPPPDFWVSIGFDVLFTASWPIPLLDC